MKRVVTIQDISCFGKCSITVALPILSCMGLETVILPTAVLSTHTMFPHPVIEDLSDLLEPIASHWESLHLQFEGIYSGYLASIRQVEITREFFREFAKDRKENPVLRFVDPAMADHGKLYAGFNKDFVIAMSRLCSDADIIVPNLTEACLLTGTPYQEAYDDAYIHLLLQKLCSLGTKRSVLITGVRMSEPSESKAIIHQENSLFSKERYAEMKKKPETMRTGIAGYDIKENRFFSIRHELLKESFHGTGDIFASTLFGALMRDMALEKAIEIAAEFTVDTMKETMRHHVKKGYGVEFETKLPALIRRVEKECAQH